jgi:AmiR/NasT family two-component response regulator
MDSLGMKEADAFGFIQRTAMNRRKSMREIAEEVVKGTVRPEGAAPSPKA